MTRYVRISENGTVTDHVSKDFTDLQEAVGGLITGVPVQPDGILDRDATVFANDEGLLIGMRPNPIAMAVTGYPHLVGPVLVGGGTDDEGNTLDIEQETVNAIHRVARLMPRTPRVRF